MTPKQILSSALVLLSDGHTSPPKGRTWLALDENANPVKPTDPRAVAWTSVGAVFAVAPVHRDKVWAETTAEGERACELLESAAVKQGFANTVEADRAGSFYALFLRATNSVEPTPFVRRRSHAGSQPKGTAA